MALNLPDLSQQPNHPNFHHWLRLQRLANNQPERDLPDHLRALVEHLTANREDHKRWRTGVPAVSFGTPGQTASEPAGSTSRDGTDVFREAHASVKGTANALKAGLPEILKDLPRMEQYLKYKHSEFMQKYQEYKKLDEESVEAWSKYWDFYENGHHRPHYHDRAMSHAHSAAFKTSKARLAREDIMSTFPGYDQLNSKKTHKERIESLQYYESMMLIQKQQHLDFVRRGF